MIACRSFSRVDCVWKFSNVMYVLSKPTNYFQECIDARNLSCNRKMGGSKGAQNAMDHNKKRRTVTSLWRPVSTQSNSHEGCSEKDVKAFKVIDCNEKSYDGIEVKVEHLNTSGCNVVVLNSSMDTGPISEQAESLTLSSISMQSNDQSEALEETSMLSVDIVENLTKSQCNISEHKSIETIYEEEVKEGSSHHLDVVACQINNAEKYSFSIEVDASLIRFIKGKGGCTQKQIEEETGVKIIFPSSKWETAIVIEGTSTENVSKASEKIKVVLEEAIKSPQVDYSHFISLPLAIHPGLVKKLNDFQNSILGNSECSQDGNLDSDSSEDSSNDREDKDNQLDGLTVADLGIDKSIFIKPKTFHLTVLMLKLWNKERVTAATEVLQGISSKVKDALDGQPVFIELKGLECMKGTQAKARVLYAPVEEIGGEDRLLRACQVIIEAYVGAGLVLEKDAHQKLKLHATLMNARHRKRKKKTGQYESFDARDIYKKYGSEEWGEYLIREAHLSQRFVFDDNGYYHCCASIPFPENMQTE